MASAPKIIQQFVSSSRQTIIEYYAYNSGLCAPGANCDFRGVITVPTGFELVEVFISGFRLNVDSHEDTIGRVSVTVQKFRYDAATGDLELGIRAGLLSGMGQDYSYRVTLVVILTNSSVAKFSPVGGGCTGIGRCSIARTVVGAIPGGMIFIGVATSNWDLGSDSGPLRLNALSGHIDSINIKTPPD